MTPREELSAIRGIVIALALAFPFWGLVTLGIVWMVINR